MPTTLRYLPDRPFPPYTYVPGQAPHPIRDPAGHMYQHLPDTPVLRVDDWWNCPDYLWGIDLFNHGYYWEAHEAWEGLWHAAGRSGPVADFLKGLIKLAAAGVKTLEGNAAGRARHLHRAVELLETVANSAGGTCMGLELHRLCESVPRCILAPEERVESARSRDVFPFVLTPTKEDSVSKLIPESRR